MSYTREEVKAITDKVLNMANADGVEVRFAGGERSATRYANSTITANLVEHDQEVQITVFYDRYWAKTQNKPFTPTSPNQSLSMEGGDATIGQMVKSTRRGLLITFFWYIRPVDQMTLLNTGMTRDGLFLIENGEIVGPVQNFRWNDGPARGFNNISMLGRPVPMHVGEAYDNPGTALVPPMKIEDFRMTSISPAV